MRGELEPVKAELVSVASVAGLFGSQSCWLQKSGSLGIAAELALSLSVNTLRFKFYSFVTFLLGFFMVYNCA